MTILISNDDGIHAPGLGALKQAVAAIAHPPQHPQNPQYSQSSQLPKNLRGDGVNSDLSQSDRGNRDLSNRDLSNLSNLSQSNRGNRDLNTVFIVAPDRQYSGCGHQVTTHQPIAWEQFDARTYAISGTPADCIRVALFDLCPSPSWILAGINAGGNLGVDAYISGTLAAVREGAMYGIPGVAISQYRDRTAPVNWDVAQQWASQVLTLLWSKDHQPGTFWNVNFPHWQGEHHHPEIVFCRPSTASLPLDYAKTESGYQYQGVYQQRMRSPGTDVDCCFAGNIAVTRLSI